MISFLNPWFLIGAGAALLLSFGSGVGVGYKWEAANFNAYKLEQAQATQELKDRHQDAVDQLRKDKDAKIANINNQLFDAINELRKRPSRPAEITSNGQSGTGASLYAEDAIFLRREAARADVIRTALEACYNQYDSVAK